MGQNPSTLLTSPSTTPSDHDTLTALALFADLKRAAFFGDVHYESSIEGDVLLPLDKVVAKGGACYCDVEGAGDGIAVGKELEAAVGGMVRGDVLDAVKVTLAQVLANALAEASNPLPGAKTHAERRHFAIVVGHLGGIYRLNYLLSTHALHSAPRNYVVAAWALSSVRLDWLALNAVNIAIEQSFLRKEGETAEEFRGRIEGVKAKVLLDWDEDQVREAAIERRKRRAGREGEEGRAV